MLIIKDFFNQIGSEIHFCEFLDINVDLRENYLFNDFLINIENYKNFIFFFFNSRLESPILNSRLRKLFLFNKNLKFFSFGSNNSYYNLPLNLFGNSLFKFIFILKNKFKLNLQLLFKKIFFFNIFIFNITLNYFFFIGISFFFVLYNFYIFEFLKN
jgi:hypothetical protein